MSDYYLKQHDTLPDLIATLKEPDGTPLDLTNALVVKFIMTGSAATPIISAAAEVQDPPTDGKVKYTWQAADTATAGKFKAEFEISFVGANKATYPNSGYLTIEIAKDLG